MFWIWFLVIETWVYPFELAFVNDGSDVIAREGFGDITISAYIENNNRNIVIHAEGEGGGVHGEDIISHIVPLSSLDSFLTEKQNQGYLADQFQQYLKIETKQRILAMWNLQNIHH